jgi:hypothetical protein
MRVFLELGNGFQKITELNQSTVMEARAIASMQMRMIKILAKTILKPI